MGFQKGHKAWNKGLTKETDERVKKSVEKLKGRKYTEETLKKMSESAKGRIPWNKGKTGIYTKETLKKIGDAQKGKKLSIEHRQKISEAQRGKKKKPLTEEHKNNLSKAAKERYKKYKHPMLGKKHTQEAKDKISVANKGNISPMKGKHQSEEAKRKMSESKKELCSDSEFRKGLSKRAKEIWERLGYREKHSGENHYNWNPNREELCAPYGVNFYNNNIRNRKWKLQNGRDMFTGIKLDPEKKPVYHHIDYCKSNDDPNNHCFLSHGNHSRITGYYNKNQIKLERYKKILQENTLSLKNGQIPKYWSQINKELFRQEKLKQLDLSSYII